MPLVEETSAAIKQTEARTSDLDSIVDQFKIRGGGASGDPAEAPPATRQDPVKSLKNKLASTSRAHVSAAAIGHSRTTGPSSKTTAPNHLIAGRMPEESFTRTP